MLSRRRKSTNDYLMVKETAEDLLAFISSYTVLKFQDFSITQILRQINFEESRSSKTAIFTILGAMEFVNLVNFSLQ